MLFPHDAIVVLSITLQIHFTATAGMYRGISGVKLRHLSTV